MRNRFRAFRCLRRIAFGACDHCGGTAIITHTMVSIYTGKTVRMFECSCGQRTWSEE